MTTEKQNIALTMKVMIISIMIILGSIDWASAQRISFSTWTGSEDIILTSMKGVNPRISFNSKKTVIVARSEKIEIGLQDEQAMVFKIDAPLGYDLTVELNSPTHLYKDGDPSKGAIPVSFRMAYNNQEAQNEFIGKQNVVEIPVGFNNVTFPVNRRLAGTPPVPITPEYENYKKPKGAAYLYIYGDFGPVGDVAAGEYTGEVLLNVYLANYEN
jgi:hypothetical protein